MAVLLGLLVAATYGSADFFGGLSSKKASVSAVVVLSQAMGVPLVAVLVLIAGGEATTKVLLLGAAAGAVGGVGPRAGRTARAGGTRRRGPGHRRRRADLPHR